LIKVRQIYNYIDEIAPFGITLDNDNVGLLVGNPEQEISKVLLSLDITPQVVDEAVRHKSGLIISHHPIIFNPIKAVISSDTSSNIPYMLIRNDISAICAHTNLDIADGGVNDVLAELLGIHNIKKIEKNDNNDLKLVRIGTLENQMDVLQYAAAVKNILDCGAVRVYNASRQVQRVAVCGGAGAFLLDEIYKAGADTYVTADIKHHEFLYAQQMNINLIDAGHFATENGIIPILAKKLSEAFRNIEFIISKNQNPVTFI
jgi:dinuclear metal center YbgI/SA1388 family protein